ncbi:hypothetical protein [Photobacterium leiognathi]|uniref:Uncharacterized protein n=1 Tax=Photobacterium leiognathi subsp. mandapamensis TaxID=48408 RepID=A0A2T3KS72_PHOLD|nr:hypothetical protein [Photobacterium leiognathi]PSV09221.1 hypothetical protein C0W93_16245 [Photobacterium leiognathi subsp. mandapamensis]
MSLVGEHRLQDVSGLSRDELGLIKSFLQGAVYCWCKNRPSEWFSLSDLMGGENYYWQGTPLIRLYEKHVKNESDNPVNQAGIDAGWLLKSVIANDPRQFETTKEYRKRIYKWCGEEHT